MTAERIVLNWKPVEGAIGYKLRLSRLDDEGLVFLEESNNNGQGSTWRTFVNLDDETTYVLEVLPIESNVVGATGSILGEGASITVITASLPLMVPRLGNDDFVSPRVVTLAPFERPQVDEYEMLRDGVVVATGGSSVSDTTVVPGQTYTYQLRERIGDRTGPLSESVVVTVPYDALNGPPIQATFVSSNLVLLRIGPATASVFGDEDVQYSIRRDGDPIATPFVPGVDEYPFVWIVDRGPFEPGQTITYGLEAFRQAPAMLFGQSSLTVTVPAGDDPFDGY